MFSMMAVLIINLQDELNPYGSSLGFKINSNLLAYYNVSPLAYFTMTKEETDGTESVITTSRNYLYGYFKMHIL